LFDRVRQDRHQWQLAISRESITLKRPLSFDTVYHQGLWKNLMQRRDELFLVHEPILSYFSSGQYEVASDCFLPHLFAKLSVS
jgi:hypothetical protein